MAATVKEIMNRELFHVRADNDAVWARNGILALHITGAAVLAEDGKPVGMITLRDLIDARPGERVGERMSHPPVVVRQESSIVDAARVVGETGHRRLIVIDQTARAVGMVSAVDLLRGLVGLPVRHPDEFPNLDPRTGLTWTNDLPFTEASLAHAPDGAGVIKLIHDQPGAPTRVVWVEVTRDVQTRLADLMSLPQDATELNRWLANPDRLRFRAASLPSPDRAALDRELRTLSEYERLNGQALS